MRSFTATLGIIAMIVVFLLLGGTLFKTCYDEHRNRGFSPVSSVVSCSG